MSRSTDSNPPPSDGPVDELSQIAALEDELQQAERALTLRRPRGSIKHGCGTPAHADAPARIREIEAELDRLSKQATTRRRVQLQRVGAERYRRLVAEAAELAAQLAVARKSATGDRSLLDRLRQLRHRRTLLSSRLAERATPSTALAKRQPSALLIGTGPGGSARSIAAFMLGAAALTVVTAMGSVAMSVMFVALAVLFGAVGVWGLTAAEDHFVGRRRIYDRPWSTVKAIRLGIAQRGGLGLEIDLGDRVVAFDAEMPAFCDIARLAFDAAGEHSIPVEGRWPARDVPSPELASRARRITGAPEVGDSDPGLRAKRTTARGAPSVEH